MGVAPLACAFTCLEGALNLTSAHGGLGWGSSMDLIAKAKAIKSEHKAIGVVCFGYFRYRNARFGCAEVHQAIQAYGREGMTRAREIAHAHGFEMVHTMTNCAFLQKPGITRSDAQRIARRIGMEVGVPMDVEGVYKWVVFLPSKTHSTTSEVGVPNRYYGKFEDNTLKVRGIEVQRHSTPEWIYEVQQGMLDVFVEADNAAGFIERIPRALDVAKQAALDMRHGRVDPKHLGTMVQTTRAVEEYRANTNTKAALERLREAGDERRPGEYVKYVVAREGGAWKGRTVPVELFDVPGPLAQQNPPRIAVHVAHYLRLLARSVETLLSPFGLTENMLYDWFAGRTASPWPVVPQQITLPERPEYVA